MRYDTLWIGALIVWCCSGTPGAYHLRDDFGSRQDHWLWIEDGRGSRLAAGQGLCTLELASPDSQLYCNAELVNRGEQYMLHGTLVIRCKGTPMLPGSRGWGWWDRNKLEVLSDFDVAWVMESRDHTPDPRTNWLSWGHNAGSVQEKVAWDLAGAVDPEVWHTYRMEWSASSVSLYVDNVLLHESSQSVPDSEMSFDIWIDNQPVGFFGPTFRYEAWEDTSRLVVDYVELYDTPPARSYPAAGPIRLWERPNAMASGAARSLWKRYSFDSPEGEAVIFVTARAEAYGGTLNDDDIKLRLNNHDFGWDTPHAIDGEKEHGRATSVAVPVRLPAGTHTLEVYADNTPLLYDVAVAASSAGRVVWDSLLQISGSGGSRELLTEVRLTASRQAEYVVFVSASAQNGERVEISIDGQQVRDPGCLIDGTEIRGDAKTVVVCRQFVPGEHRIALYESGKPTVHRLTVFAADRASDPIARPGNKPNSSHITLVGADGRRETIGVPYTPTGGSCGMYTVDGRAIFVRNHIASDAVVQLPAIAPGLSITRIRFGDRESRNRRVRY